MPIRIRPQTPTDEEKEAIWEALLKARSALGNALVYISDVLFALNLVKEDAFSEKDFFLCIERDWRVVINYPMMAGAKNLLSPDLFILFCAFLLYHEALHVLAAHFERQQHRQSTLWNISTDLEVNPTAIEIIEDASLRDFLTAILYFPEKYKLPPHMPAEYYYERLLTSGMQQLQKSGTIAVDMLSDKQSGGGQITELIRHALREKTARAILEHHKTKGTVPQGLLRWAQEFLKPKVNWREILRRHIHRRVLKATARGMDFTYLRPHKKTDWHKQPTAILPSQVAPDAKIGVIIDTSGSMSEKELGQAIAEVREICRGIGAFVHIIACDAAVQAVLTNWGNFLHRERLAKILKGGGGTVLTTGILYAQEKLKCNLAVVLTDAESFWEEVHKIRIPVIIGAINPTETALAKIPPTFDVVVIEAGENR